MKNFITLIFVSLLTFTLSAQQDSVKYNWGVYGDNVSPAAVSDSIIEVSPKQLKLENINNGKQGEIKIASPIELKTITDEVEAIKDPVFKGYRVQVMLSQNKNDVLKIQSEFIRFNKDVEVYIDRKAPNYRLRVGDFHNKFDAFAFQKKIDEKYPNSLVVSDEIRLPKLNLEEPEEVEVQTQNETE